MLRTSSNISMKGIGGLTYHYCAFALCLPLKDAGFRCISELNALQTTSKPEKGQASTASIPKDAAYVAIGSLLMLLVFYTFHCVWVMLLRITILLWIVFLLL